MLDTVQATDAPLWRPMQAFYLQTGLRDSACTEAPASGVLVQTPAGAETVTFRVNEVDIALGSTAYLQAGDELRVAVVEGQAEVTAFDVTRTVPAGAQVFVPLDANGVASGPPGLPEAYAIEGMAALPVTLLDEAVVVAEPLSDRELTRYTNCLVRASTNVNLRTGPGDSYYLEREMPPGTMLADAQAQDVDGTVWWRLSTDVWLNSDDVQEIGGCDVLPMVEPPSPSIDEIVTHFSEIIMVDFSEACEARYPIGTTIRVGWGDDGRWLDRSANAQEAAAYFSALGHFITINGVGVPISERVFWGSNPYGPGWNYYSYYDWTPTETGVYRVIGDDPSPAPPVGCTVTIY